MGDLGKILYEIHAVSAAAYVADPSWIRSWDKLDDKAKEAWRNTAQEFLKQMNGE